MIKKDSDFYLILGLGAPIFSHPVILCKCPDADICTVQIVGKTRYNNLPYDLRNGGRYAILFEVGTFEKASKITDAILSLFFVLYKVGPPNLTPFPLSKSCLQGGWKISIKAITKSIEKELMQRYESEFYFLLHDATYLPAEYIKIVFSKLPIVVSIPELLSACHFFKEGLDYFAFYDDDIKDIESEPKKYPDTETLQVKAESALFNAYKSIEALIGEPGKKEEKNRERLSKWGINPDGNFKGGTILSKVLWLQNLRDLTAGHGKKRRCEPLTYYEVMESQELARTILLSALVYKQETNPRSILKNNH